MLKPTLIALATLGTFDAIVTGGRHIDQMVYACMTEWHHLVAMGWSLTLS